MWPLFWLLSLLKNRGEDIGIEETVGWWFFKCGVLFSFEL
jgi:hypothetical protein